MLEIKVLGSGCPNCQKLEQLVLKVCSENNINSNVQKITDFKEFGKYGVMMTPGLVVNNKTLIQGKIPTEITLKHWLLDLKK